ncbi:hypothetical protein DJ72_03160 [Halorubrum distributum]|nr:hypothetical protein DJ72_03160 [Halorubrum distributum]
MIERVLVAMDGSDLSERALRYALDGHPDAEITVLNVVGGASPMMGQAVGIALSDDGEEGIREALPDELAYCGRVPPREDLEIPDRHLGLRMGEAAPLDDDALAAAAETLRGSVSRTRASVRERVGGEDPLDEEDLSGTVAQELAATGETRVESAVEDVSRATDAGEHATAVVEAGTALAEVEAYRAAVGEIRDGRHRAAPTESSVRSTAERARAAVSEAVDAGDPLAARLLRPGLGVFGYAADRVEEGYGSAPRRTQASLVYAALYASAVPAAAEFVRERLE